MDGFPPPNALDLIAAPEFTEKTGSDLIAAALRTNIVTGTSGNDLLRGTAEKDLVYGYGGTDRLYYFQNADASIRDTFYGGSGQDQAVLVLTEEIWLSAAFQADLAAWIAFAAASQGKLSFGEFTFVSLGLTVSSIEGLQVLVNDTLMNLTDEAVKAVKDTFTVNVNASYLAGNVLANDSVPDLVASLTVSTQPKYGTVILDADGNFVFDVDTDNAKVAALTEGQTLTDSFYYTVVDADGDSVTAKVVITITGPEPEYGFLVQFNEAGDAVGVSVASAGDVNGDGIEDFMIGSPTADEDGRVYVIFGIDGASGTTFDQNFDLSTLDGTNGFTIVADPEMIGPGYSVASVGDVNGDGIDDLIIGAAAHRQYGQGYTGVTYIVFGVDTSVSGDFGATLDLANLNGTNGFTLTGVSPDDNFGYKVAAAGDVNGDGIDDFLIGAYGVDQGLSGEVGCAYVVFGVDTSVNGNFDAVFDISTLDGTNGFAIPGLGAEDQTGHSVASADVNGDGIDDIIVGAYGATVRGSTYAGEVYVIFGQDTDVAGDFDATFDLTTLDGTNGFVLRSTGEGDSAGRCVASIGDVNGDGIDDFAIAGFGYDPTTDQDGTVYVVFGRDTATEGDFAATINLATLNGTTGFMIQAANPQDLMGRTNAGVGDINGDGVDDFMIGAPNADPNGVIGAGESYLIFGKDTATQGDFEAVFDPNDLDGTNGYRFQGRMTDEFSGYAVSGSDVNNDGTKDLIIGCYGEEERTGLAVQLDTYVIYGGIDNLQALDAKDGVVDGSINLAYLTPDAFLF